MWECANDEDFDQDYLSWKSKKESEVVKKRTWHEETLSEYWKDECTKFVVNLCENCMQGVFKHSNFDKCANIGCCNNFMQ